MGHNVGVLRRCNTLGSLWRPSGSGAATEKEEQVERRGGDRQKAGEGCVGSGGSGGSVNIWSSPECNSIPKS